MDTHKIKVLGKVLKLLLVNVLVFVLAITILETSNAKPDMVWEGALGFYIMEAGYLLGKENRKD